MSFTHESVVVAGYIRRSSKMQAENFSIEAQKRAITEECVRRNIPLPVFYEDDERSARGEQIAKRPAFKQLLTDVEAGRIQIIMVHTLDRWSRNVAVTLQSFRILADQRTAFVSLSEHIDYSTPEGRLQLTILAAFAAYFSDMLAKHVAKGKGERAAQGLFNGDIPFGYRGTGKRTPPEPDPKTFPGLRLIGALRMKGMSADQIADALNARGYRIQSKRFGERVFTAPTINAITKNIFYAAYAPGDTRGTIVYHDQRYRGQHEAAFTAEEWERIRVGTRANYNAPHRAAKAHLYVFSGYLSCAHCGTNLPAKGYGEGKYSYYKDMAKARKLSCASSGTLHVRKERVVQQFGELLQQIQLPASWHDLLHQKVLELAGEGFDAGSAAREKERLLLKRSRILKQHREGYITDMEFESEMAAVTLALQRIAVPELGGTKVEEIMAMGEKLPAMTTLWQQAMPEEQREMVMLLVEPGGVFYDLEAQQIAAIVPRPAFLPLLGLSDHFKEYEESPGTLITTLWRPNIPHLLDRFRSDRSARDRSGESARAHRMC
jgi:site-specific DNA recombinase